MGYVTIARGRWLQAFWCGQVLLDSSWIKNFVPSPLPWWLRLQSFRVDGDFWDNLTCEWWHWMSMALASWWLDQKETPQFFSVPSPFGQGWADLMQTKWLYGVDLYLTDICISNIASKIRIYEFEILRVWEVLRIALFQGYGLWENLP